jgi:hypothetical protein
MITFIKNKIIFLVILFPSIALMSQQISVIDFYKISDQFGNFNGILDDEDRFGWEIASLGDLDNDYNEDFAIGARNDDDGGYDRGAVWILFMNSDKTVKCHTKISSLTNNFSGVLDDEDRFGYAVTSVGDLDGDNVTDIAVGARNDDDGGLDKGAVWIIFLNENGTIKGYQKISELHGDFYSTLYDQGGFGSAICNLGDIDGDGTNDIAVGATRDNDGGTRHGAIWIIFLNPNGTVKYNQKISSTEGNFYGSLDTDDYFGCTISGFDDLDNDGINEIIVGAHSDDDGGLDKGALWILYLNQNATVKMHAKISDIYGQFSGFLHEGDHFGCSIESINDINNDGISDLACGSSWDDDGGLDRGAVWILSLNQNAEVSLCNKISSLKGSFKGNLDNDDRFGESLQLLWDNVDNPRYFEIAVGASFDDDGGYNRGAVWILSVLLNQVDIGTASDIQILTSNSLSLNLSEISKNINIEIFNMLGQKVKSLNLKDTDKISLDISNFTKGINILTINTDKGFYTKKIFYLK